MNLYTASAVASRLGFVLPTRKIVDAIYQQSAFHFSPRTHDGGTANEVHRILPDS